MSSVVVRHWKSEEFSHLVLTPSLSILLTRNLPLFLWTCIKKSKSKNVSLIELTKLFNWHITLATNHTKPTKQMTATNEQTNNNYKNATYSTHATLTSPAHYAPHTKAYTAYILLIGYSNKGKRALFLNVDKDTIAPFPVENHGATLKKWRVWSTPAGVCHLSSQESLPCILDISLCPLNKQI